MSDFSLGTSRYLADVADSSSLLGPAVCGNQILESTEECDCGTPDVCTRYF